MLFRSVKFKVKKVYEPKKYDHIDKARNITFSQIEIVSRAERLFYCALIGYIWYEAPEEEKNFTTLLEMINASEAREDDPEFQ